MNIRLALVPEDYDQVWEIFKSVISEGDSFVFDPETKKEDMMKYWFAPSMETFVGIRDKIVVGSYFIKPNQLDLGNHIANCGYMVHKQYRGQKIASLLCEHSINHAKSKGYTGMQFNIVVSTNLAAVNLWKNMGFEVTGTTPKGFRHKLFGMVDTFIMFKAL